MRDKSEPKPFLLPTGYCVLSIFFLVLLVLYVSWRCLSWGNSGPEGWDAALGLAFQSLLLLALGSPLLWAALGYIRYVDDGELYDPSAAGVRSGPEAVRLPAPGAGPGALRPGAGRSGEPAKVRRYAGFERHIFWAGFVAFVFFYPLFTALTTPRPVWKDGMIIEERAVLGLFGLLLKWTSKFGGPLLMLVSHVMSVRRINRDA